MNIYGEKVTLRPITPEDTDLIVKWRNNPAVRHNFVYQALFTRETHEHWLATKVKSGEVDQYIIHDKSSGLPVGSVYFSNIDKTHQKAEFGLFIGEDAARGKGLGAETAALFVNYGFEQLKLHRIYMRVFPDNVGSIISTEKAGFVFEGRFKDDVCIDGVFHDMIFMACVKNDER